MDVLVLPLRAIAFQILFLLMAIAIEGTVMQQQLPFMPRQAMQYATILNLITVVVGEVLLGSASFSFAVLRCFHRIGG